MHNIIARNFKLVFDLIIKYFKDIKYLLPAFYKIKRDNVGNLVNEVYQKLALVDTTLGPPILE